MPTDAKNISGRKLAAFGLLGLCVAGGVVVNGINARAKTDSELKNWTEAQALQTVAVAHPDKQQLSATLDLPGRLEAYSRAPIFSRVSGYLKSWSADIGKPVQAGQTIAEIEAPDLDQDLLKARADLLREESGARLSEATLARRQTLVASNFVSAQEIDERTADLANKRASVSASRANVERLEALAGFKKISVPFDGIITARNTDVGALITGGVGTGLAMFVVSDVRKLRVYVNVPQAFVPLVKLGAAAAITLPEHAGRTFSATVEASSQSVDAASGTTRMQLLLDNSKGELMPGGYASVKIDLAREGSLLSVPASALIFNRNGLSVATVDANERIVLKQVTIARDLGRYIEIETGLSADDRIIPAPPDGLVNGDQVRVVRGPGEQKGRPTATSQNTGHKG